MKNVLSEQGQIFAAYRQIPEVVIDDLKKAFILRGSYTKGDTHETAYHEGQRDVAMRIIHLADREPEPTDFVLVPDDVETIPTGPKQESYA